MGQPCDQIMRRDIQSVENMPRSYDIDNWNNEVFKFECDSLIKNKLGLVVNKRYEVMQRIDAGAFGSTYIAEDLESGRQRVAVKFDTGRPEWKKSKRDENHLKYEFEVYKSALYDDGYNRPMEGFASVHWFGYEYNHNILVMELLGASIASLFTFCDRRFGWQTILSLAQQMLCRIRHIHVRGFIHRDIKPENFLMGLGDRETTCYLIDFGLARRYRFRNSDDRTLRHIPFRRGRSFIGTAKYASINSHRNVELARRDDLESLGYVIIELVNGSLPWRNICRRNQVNKHQTYQRIRMAKETANWREICPCMADFMRYVRGLQFCEEPDYDRVLMMLQGALSGGAHRDDADARCEACTAQLLANDPAALSAEPLTASVPDCSRLCSGHELTPSSSARCEPLTDVNGLGQQLNHLQLDDVEEDLKDKENLRTHPDVVNVKADGITMDLIVNNNERDFDADKTHEVLDADKHGELDKPKEPESDSSAGEKATVDKNCDGNGSQTTTEGCCSESGSRHSSTAGTKTSVESVPQPSSSAIREDDKESVGSCRNCFLKQKLRNETRRCKEPRMSWQIWRESTPENRFEYDNRFSWTLPPHRKPNHFQPSRPQEPCASSWPPALVLPATRIVPGRPPLAVAPPALLPPPFAGLATPHARLALPAEPPRPPPALPPYPPPPYGTPAFRPPSGLNANFVLLPVHGHLPT